MLNKIVLSILFGILSLGIVGFSNAYAANANLYVSAENAEFSNYMSGPQVIEVIIIDSTISDTDIPAPEPDVTVNGKLLRMVQAVDGNWYGYFADRNMAQIADSTAVLENGVGLDYGDFCGANDGSTVLGIDLSETDGFAISNTGEVTGLIGIFPGSHILDNCIFTAGTSDNTMNVLRETKDVNPDVGVGIGQIGLNSVDNWPFIQLYELNPTGIVQIDYNTGSGLQRTILTFDTVENFAGTQLDRATYPIDSQVHPVITDIWLNIDPTDEDSWTFGTYPDEDNATTNYQVFDENGFVVGDTPENTDNNLLTALLPELMCEDNCRLLLDPNITGSPITPLTIQDNDDTEIVGTDVNDALSFQTINGNLNGKIPLTLTESSSNTGVFVMRDESDSSILKITHDAKRGTAAALDYNENPVTILVNAATANIDIQLLDNEWNSGEEIPVFIIDSDSNKNSLSDEDLDFYNPDVELIPSIVLGTPFTLETLNDATLANNPLSIQTVQQYSQRALLQSPLTTIDDGDSLELSTSETFANLYNSINDSTTNFSGFNSFNFDIRSIENSIIGGTIDSMIISITDGTNTVDIGTVSNFDGLITLDDTSGIFSLNENSDVKIIFTFDTSGSPVIPDGTVLPMAVDFFSTGYYDDGLLYTENINNQIIRIEAEETGDNTSTFEGSLTFTMLNQLNSQQSFVFFNDDLLDFSTPISDDVEFPIIDIHFDLNSILVYYHDLDASGVPTVVADSVDIFPHSGSLILNSNSYDSGDTVSVTVSDLDLSLDDDLFDVYTVVDPAGVFGSYSYSSDPARDSVGKVGLGTFTNPSLGPVGTLYEVTFDDKRWSSGLLENGGTCEASGTPDDGLARTGFTLVETTTDSGIFEGEFVIPDTFCDSNNEIVSTIGSVMSIKYVDFRNEFSAISLITNDTTIGPIPVFCNDQTIDELSSSGLYNVIDNRDGHLDGARIDGTNADDLILASDAGNEIRSKKGNDCVIGGSGNDELRGGSDNDQLFGNGGNDLILGGNHDDLIYGGEGDDELRGGKGIDSIFGETGNDNLKGNNDNDALSCGDGIDIANGGRGTDTATSDCETIKKVP